MIPLPPQLLAARAVLKSLPWKLIGYGIAVLALLLFAWRVHAWRQGYLALEATEKELAESNAKVAQYERAAAAAQEAFTRAVTEAKSIEAADRAAAEKVEHDLQTKLAAASSSSADLSRRLHDYEARRCRGAVSSAASTPGQPPAPGAVAGSEEGTGAAIDAAHDRYHATCDLDAIAADGWWAWWQSVQPNR